MLIGSDDIYIYINKRESKRDRERERFSLCMIQANTCIVRFTLVGAGFSHTCNVSVSMASISKAHQC